MKRVRCPKCKSFITFDETKYSVGQRLAFVCPNCNKQFGIRLGVSAAKRAQKVENAPQESSEEVLDYGSLHVIENVFHYKQILPLKLGEKRHRTLYERKSHKLSY